MFPVANSTGSLPLVGRLKFLLGDTTLYGGASAISAGFALITFSLLTRHFTIEEYGIIDYFLVLASLLAIFFVFGQDSMIARYLFEYEDLKVRQQLVSQSLVFQLLNLALLLPILWLGSEWLTRVMTVDLHPNLTRVRFRCKLTERG